MISSRLQAMTFWDGLFNTWRRIETELFPNLEEEIGPLPERYRKRVTVLEFVRVAEFLPYPHGAAGRPPADRAALARALIAKAVFELPTTDLLIERLALDKPLRRLCGWTRPGEIPQPWTFSRAFAEFATRALPSRLHGALIKAAYDDRLVGHISRDSPAIEAREKPVRASPASQPPPPPAKRGRPRKGEQRPEPLPRRLERPLSMSLDAMLAELPRACEVGSKRNAKGPGVSWIGDKLHMDVADGGIPISCVLTPASLHDSQAAIPSATLAAQRVVNPYDLMDSAYDAPEIHRHSRSLRHVPIIDLNVRRDAGRKREQTARQTLRQRFRFRFAEAIRYTERTAAERANGRLKDNLGARTVRVRGPAKGMCPLMFGVLALTVDQLVRLVT
jgi:hypothetical protein